MTHARRGRSRLFGALGLLAVLPVSLFAQTEEPVEDTRSDEWHIAATVLAAPPQYRETAEVRKWVDGELVTIREGSGLICLADQPGGAFQVACYHESLEPFMARGRELRASGIEGMSRQQQRWADADAGRISMPDGPAMVYNLGFPCEDFDPADADPTTVGRLHAVYRPYLAPEESGLPIAPQGSEPWLMWPGKAGAHIMMPVPAAEGDPVCPGG